ncbi:MAG: sensor histidine kinase [Roseateles depolymerans]|uniref:Sensor histidine kinase n=1 Tax=Roseateles depolymerans TaxID=76731 RepID=A0A2W5DMN6_9BURK|nr:MAG: sensor histidine kinase [Roseateles depolymerans]
MEDRPLQAFRRVCNLRVLAAVYYFCQLYALSRGLTWFDDAEHIRDTLFAIVRFTRQSLLSGISLLLMAGLAEALLAALAWRGRRALVLQVLAVVLGAALGSLLRVKVASLDDPNLRVRPVWVASTIAIWGLFGGVAYALLRQSLAERAGRSELSRLGLEREALLAQQTEAQLSALNAQIEPHFLFNTLANVKRLYETAPERGRHMLMALIAYLRAALPGMRRQESTLADELELVRHYLAILQMRMGDRLSFTIDAEPALLQARLPTLVLPTLVENAIKHGLSPLPEGGHITIRARLQGAELRIEVEDDGAGFGSASGGAGVGLANTRARLAARFGDAAALELEAAQPRGVIARVRLPAQALPATPRAAAA